MLIRSKRAAPFGALLALVSALLAPICARAQAQWNCGGGACTTTGNVGIGTQFPATALDIEGVDASTTLTIGNGSSPTTQRWPGLVVNNYAGAFSNSFPYFGLNNSRGSSASPSPTLSNDTIGMLLAQGQYDTTVGHISKAASIQFVAEGNFASNVLPTAILFNTAPSTGGGPLERMRINNSGNVGIGTTNPQYLLTVNGAIGTNQVVVTSLPLSDYVFDSGYRLAPLSEVSAFIQANHHLPDIPSDAEAREKGVDVGGLEAKLLAKIEELTLHLIRQEKENRELRDRVGRLEGGANLTGIQAAAK